MSVRALAGRPGFRALLVGQGVSALGDWMGTVAFMALTLELTGSPTAVGGILTLRLLPAVVAGPVVTRAVQRWDRRTTMLAMDGLRAGLIALVPLVRALWWVYLLAVLVEVASIVFLPARDASIPDLVDADDLPVANGLVLGSSYATIPLGAAAFAAFAALPLGSDGGVSFAAVFLVDAATFLVSFACIRTLPLPGRVVPAAPAVPTAPTAPTAPTDAPGPPIRFRAAFGIPLVRAVLPATAAVALGLGALFSLGIVFVQDVLGASPAEFGILIALFGVGAVGGLGVLHRRRDRDALLETRRGVMAIGAVIAAFSLAGDVLLAFVGALAFGGAAAFTLASGMGVLQRRLDGDLRVVAFAVFHVVIRCALGVAAVVAGLAGDLLGGVPGLDEWEPARLVLLGAGGLIMGSALGVRVRVAATADPDPDPGSAP